MPPSHATRLRVPLPRILAGLVAAVLVLVVPAAWSRADTVPGAITNVSIRQTSTAVGSAMTLDLQWQVPDGSRAGDTFSLTLPSELAVLGGTDFPLKDGTDTVANASIAGRVVTFTMTSYAGSHLGVHGSAFFSVTLQNSVQPGPLDLVFTTNTTTFRDHVDVGVLPATDYSGTATKWAKWLPAGTPGDNRLLWAIAGPRVTGSAPYLFTDTPGPGQAIDCASLEMWSGTANMGGSLVGPTWVGKDRWTTLECSATKAVVRFVPKSSDVGRVFMLMGRARLTDTTLAEYSNSGSVAIGGGSIPVTTVVAGAGGVGTGTATAPASSVPATTTTPSTSPGTPTDTATCAPVTVTVTDTATVTQTVTQTVTAGPVQPGVTVTQPPVTVTQTVTAPVYVPVPGPVVTVTGPAASTVTVTAGPPATSSMPPVASGTSVATGTAPGGTTSPAPGSPSTSADHNPTGSASPPDASEPPIASGTTTSAAIPGGGTSTSGNGAVAPGTTPGAPPVTTPPVAGATTPAGNGAANGTVTGVNTGIAPDDGPQGLMVGLGMLLLAGSGGGLVLLARRRGDG